MSNESPRHGVPPRSADHSHTERQYESPLSEGAQIPHSSWDSSGHSGEAAGEPMQAGTGHGVAGDRWRGRAAAHDRGGRSGPPPGDAAHGGYHAHDDPDSGGAHAFHPQPASNSGGYEGTGFNRGYGIEARGYRRSEHHADIGTQFGDIGDFDDLYGEGRHGGLGHGRPHTLPRGYRRADERVLDDVCERLSRSGLDVSEVSVRVVDGEVVLEGSVRERGAKYAIENIADGCLGVKDVDNRLRVAQDVPARPHPPGR